MSFITFTSIARKLESGTATVRAIATPISVHEYAAADRIARNGAVFAAYVSQEADTWDAYQTQVRNAEARAYRARQAA
jgi:hypothetical protein